MKEKTSSPPARVDRGTLLAFAVLMAAAAFFFLFRLGERPFRNPDEGRYAEVAREILQSGDWVKPTLYGVGYLRKPVLFYWLIAGSFQWLGRSEFSARLVPALFSLFGIAAVFWFCLRTFGKRTAFFAASMLATNFWFLQVGRYLVIDAVFTFLVVACLLAFYSGRFLWFYVLLALAFLAKGLIALAIPIVSIGCYALWNGAFWETLRAMRLLPGIPVFLSVAAPWYVLIERREPGFLKFFFGHEHWMRLVSADFEHQEPWFYYFVALPLMLTPWVLFVRPLKTAFSGLRRRAARDPRVFLILSAVATLVFFSLSRSKMPTYILPCLPLLAVVLGDGWARWLESGPVLGRPEIAATAFMILAALALMAGGTWFAGSRADQFPAALALNLQLLGGSLLAGGVVCLRAIRQRRPEKLFYALAVTLGFFSVFFTFTMETMNPLYSTKAFAAYLKDRVSASDEIFVFDHPGPFYDFAYYLDRDVKLVGLEGELEYSRADRNADKVSVSRSRFFERLEQGEKLYCLMRRSDFMGLKEAVRAKLTVLKQDGRKVLFLSGAPGEHP